MSLRFTNPQYLFLLPLFIIYIWYVSRHTLAELDKWRDRVSFWIRTVVGTAIILAISGIQIIKPTTNLCTSFVVDLSFSSQPMQQEALSYIQEAIKKKHSGDLITVVAFGGDAWLDKSAEDKEGKIDRIYSLPKKSRTNISAGIQLAMAAFPEEAGKQIVILTDGNENQGNVLSQAEIAAANDIKISVIPLKRNNTNEVLLSKITAPSVTKIGSPINISVTAETTKDITGKLNIYRNDTLYDSKTVKLQTGKNIFSFDDFLNGAGLFQYKATIEVPKGNDELPDNNQVYCYTRVAGKTSTLIVEGAEGDGEHLAQTLKTNGIEVVLGKAENVPKNLAECSKWDSIIFANVPAWQISPNSIAAIQGAVKDTGMGFMMTGGTDSFGAGGYFSTQIENILPVSMDTRKKKKYSSIAIVLVIEYLEEQAITNRSIEAAKATVDMLLPTDKIGVENCGYDKNLWPIPMQPVQDKEKIKAEMDQKLQEMYDPPSYESHLQEAANVLMNTKADVKHILLVGDGDAYMPNTMLATIRKIKREGITVSAISTGVDGPPGLAEMQKIASQGGGVAYEAKRPEDLPRLLVRDQQSVTRPPIYEKPFRVIPIDTTHASTKDIDWGNAPPLMGYTITSNKENAPTARILLSSPENDPIFAVWQYGLGKTAAFASEPSSHWGLHWMDWPDEQKFWMQSTRWILRNTKESDLQLDVFEQNSKGIISIEAVDKNGQYKNGLNLSARVSHIQNDAFLDPKTETEMVDINQSAPGHYEGFFNAGDNGAYQITVIDTKTNGEKSLQQATLVIPYSPEYGIMKNNDSLISQIVETGKGEVNPPADDIFGRMRFGARTLSDLWTILIPWIAFIFIFDVAVRRVVIPPADVMVFIKKLIKAFKNRSFSSPTETVC
ncbi:MAG: VWA domain-containing protein, partial [bacterium]